MSRATHSGRRCPTTSRPRRPVNRLDEIRDLYRYNRWANGRVLDAADALSDEDFVRDVRSSFASIRDTLVHILAAEWVWLSRWKGSSPRSMPDGWPTSALRELRTRWSEVEGDQRAFLAELEESRLDEIVSYATTDGRAFAMPLWQMLRHVVNHSSYHRGQVVTMLRQLRAEGCATDLILYFRSSAEEGRGVGGRD